MDSLSLPPANPRPQATSELLEGLVGAFPGERVTVGELLEILDTRAHGVLLLVLALPMCIPNLPGISTIFGLLLIAPALQMILGHGKMWLPKSVRSWSFPRSSLEATIRRTAPVLRRVEYLIKPRLGVLTRWPATSFIGGQTFLMALILILPIWGANLSPGITVVLTALALLQRDGVLMLLSVAAAAGSVAWVYFTWKVSLAALHWIFDGVQSLISWIGG
jgi:hypothetical protein